MVLCLGRREGTDPDLPEQPVSSRLDLAEHPELRQVGHPGVVAPVRRGHGRSGLCSSQSSVRWPALSAAMTKHNRSGPRAGNGFEVYFMAIRSMTLQSWS